LDILAIVWPARLLPLCGVFFVIDGKLLNDWRSQLLDAWVKHNIEFRALRDAVGAIPTLPKDTLNSMLATLPSAGELAAEQRICPSTREAIAALAITMYACQSDAMALRTVAFAIVVGSLILSVTFWTWLPILGIIAIAPLPIARKFIRKRRLKALRQRTLAAQKQLDFDHTKYMELANSVSCQPFSESEWKHSSVGGIEKNVTSGDELRCG
jgi:hypothetical protein